MKPRFLISALLSAHALHPISSNFQVGLGSAEVIVQSPDAIEILVSDRALLNWSDLSIGLNESLCFQQPSSTSCVLNRITGNNPTEIFGALKSNGKVLLINPNGILFGTDSQIDVGSLIASTLDLEAFENQDEWIFTGPSKEYILNEGRIKAENGDIILIGRRLENNGEIHSPSGSITFAGSSEAVVYCLKDAPVSIKLSGTESYLDQSGNLSALRIDFQADGNPYQLAFKHSGSTDALSIVETEGGIFLKVPSGDSSIEGSLSAPGGRIELTGERIGIIGKTNIDASSPFKAGTVLIGGDFQGMNPSIQNAKEIYIDSQASISANATQTGDGGRLILWADESNRCYGQLFATGGPCGGDGGFIEVSSKASLDFQGMADLRAVCGKGGTLLLDPTQITITTGTANVALGNCAFPANTYASSAASGTLLNTTLSGQLGLGNVIITTSDGMCGPFAGTGDIIVSSIVNWTSNFSLTLNAARDILVTNTGDIRNDNLGNGSITLNAARNVSILADVRNANSASGNALSGNVTVLAQTGNITIGSLTQTRSISVCARKGTTLVEAPRGSITLLSGTANQAYTTIGERGQNNFPASANTPIANGPILVNAGQDLYMEAGAGQQAYVSIGKMGSVRFGPAPPLRVDRTDITVNVARNLRMLASPNNTASIYSDCFIGHGGSSAIINPTTALRIGDYNINVGNNLYMSGRGANGCYIGSGIRGANQSIININVGGNFTLDGDGAFNLTRSACVWGFEDTTSQFLQTFYINVGGNLTLDGRSATTLIRCLNRGTNVAAYPKENIVHVGGEINVLSDPRLTGAGILHVGPITAVPWRTEIWAGGGIRAYNWFNTAPGTTGAFLFFTFTLTGVPSLGNVSVRSGQDIIQAAGTSTFAALNSLDGSLLMEADASFAAGALWSPKTAIVNGSNIFTGTPLGVTSLALASDGIGGVAFDFNQYDLNLTTYPQSANGVFPPLFPTPVTIGTSPQVYNFLDIQISSTDLFSNGSPADLLNLGGGNSLVQLNATAQDVSVEGFRNVLMTGVSITAAENVLATAENNMDLVGASINAGLNIDLVVDNQAPTRPLIGPGAFTMDGASAISSTAGYIRIYTAQQGLNSIDPAATFTSGGVPYFFTPGTLFIDTIQEQWCTYYPEGTLGVPFRIFYKDCLQQVVQQATIVIDQLLVDLHPYNEFPGWVSRFTFFYKHSDDSSPDEPFRITRRALNHLNHPKSYTQLTPE